MRVAFLTSEVSPYCKTGGLADVSAALPAALHAAGAEVHVFAPYYRQVRRYLRTHDLAGGLAVGKLFVHRLGHAHFVTLRRKGAPTFHFLDCPLYYERDGLYGPSGAEDFPDNAARFGLFCHAVAAQAAEVAGGPIDVFHANDWQTGLVPVLVRDRRGPGAAAAVMGIHNLAYPGIFEPAAIDPLEIDRSLFHPAALEYYGKVCLLKGGVVFADAITTVSPTYAEEILSPEMGMGLDGVLRDHRERMVGILNGIDVDNWNPASDPRIVRHYHRGALAGKAACRRALLAEMSLPDDFEAPVAAVISRLVPQKGIDLVADLVDGPLRALGVRLVVVGSGDPALERRLRGLAAAHPDQIAVRITFDDKLAHRVEAGADLFLMPSRFEPCGLGQMYAMAYGTVPVAAAVGGLRDTIVDAGEATLADGTATGFLFHPVDADHLAAAIGRAVACYRQDAAAWRAIMVAGMARDASWGPAASAHLAVYDRALARRRGR
jgi:starch synthase